MAVPARNSKITVEPTEEAEQRWVMEVLSRASALRGAAGCGPSYFNNESDLSATGLSMEEQILLAWYSGWGEGIANYANVIETWRAKGDMDGLDVHSIGFRRSRLEEEKKNDQSREAQDCLPIPVSAIDIGAILDEYLPGPQEILPILLQVSLALSGFV